MLKLLVSICLMVRMCVTGFQINGVGPPVRDLDELLEQRLPSIFSQQPAGLENETLW